MKLSKKQRAMLRRDIAPHTSWMTSLLDDLDETEARAERYEKTLRDAEQWLGCEEPHVPSVLHNIRTALAETEKEKP